MNDADGIGHSRVFGLKSMKSILLAVLMVSMSLSVGLVELNKAPWLVEDGESQLEELNNPMHTTAPSISYSSSTLALSNNTAMTPLTVTNSGGTVGIPIADNWGSISQSISMALDSDGYKHVSFYHNSDRDLYYSTDASGVWANVSVDTEGQVGNYESIAVDSEDNVHIAYYSTRNGANAFTKDLKYATCASSCESSSSWSNITIDSTGEVGLQTSIAVDSNDALHISYLDLTNDKVKYATCASSCGSASSWSVVSVDGIGTGVMQAGIAIDSNDDVHIVYTAIPSGATDYVVNYATCSSSCSSTSSWTTTTGIHPDVNVKQLSFTIDSNDALHIATHGVTSKEVYYGICATLCTSSSSWSNVSIGSHTSQFFGNNPSISVDSNNNPHIVYRGIDPTGSTSNSALDYATCISSCLSDSSFWSVIAVDGRGGAGFGTAIAVNQGNDSVHMVYAKYDLVDGGDIHYLSTDTAPYSISPDLPKGLSLDWGSGKISGTPTELSSSTTYTITARNAHGSDTTTLTISVNAPPLMSYDWGSGSSNFISSEHVNNKVSVGNQNTCAIRENGSLMCWGQDNKGQLGDGGTNTEKDTPVYANLPAGRKAVAVSAGALNACALLDNGSMMCWGDDVFGQLGNGATTTIEQDEPVYVNLPTGRTAVGLSLGWAHVCAILDTGSLMCWGAGADGRLGNGEGTNQFSPVSVDLPYGRTAVAVDAGERHTCAILDTGSLMCWGRDHRGQLGDGAPYSPQNSPVFVELPTGRTAVSIVAGKEHSCALLDNRSVMCWGLGSSGQLGNGATNVVSNPVPVYVDLPIGRDALMISAAYQHTCAVLDNSSTYCWGVDNRGQLGNGATTTATQSSPVYVNLSVGRNPASISPSAASFHTCAILDNASMECWGYNSLGQLGDGGAGADQFSPVSVSGSYTWDNTTNLVSSTLRLVQNVPMNSLSPTFDAGFGAPTSCGHTPSLPPGLFLSNTCVLSGTPTNTGSTTLTITPSNAKGDGLSVSLIVNVNAAGGSITINTTSTEGGVGSAISDITMSYTHTASIPNWVSGVTNSTVNPAPSIPAGGGSKLSIDSGLNGDIAAVYSVERTGATSANLSLLYKWNGAWTESTIDSSVDTEVPSVAIDRQGALHIGYVDKDNAKLKYATNASGSWVVETLGDAATHQFAQTAISVHPVTNAVHIMVVNGSTIPTAGLNHHTNETGTWLKSTISDPSEEEGFGVNFDIDSNGNLHVVFRREANSVTTPDYDHLIMASRINGVWQNQTIATNLINGAYGHNFDMAIDSQDQIHVTFHGKFNLGKWIWHGVLSSVNPSSSWVLTQLSTSGFWPALAVDSNDNVHLSYHGGSGSKDQWYQTYTSGTWSSRIETSATAGNIHGGFFNEMTTDSNDDVFIFAYGQVVSTCKSCDIRITRIQGLGPSLATNPIFEVSPPLPDGLNMNWHNGTISGTPTEGHANTTHTVTVTAFGATTTETFTLMVIEAPNISYGQSSYTFTNNTALSGVTLTNTGGAPSGTPLYARDGTLPTGILFNSMTGEIYGIPYGFWSTTFTVWANNSAGSNSTTITINVQEEAPDIAYAGSPFTFTKNGLVSGATATNVGGVPDAWAIDPEISTSIPGLSFNTATGAITGTPT
ncbi:putative Ig domain-containing protein, partial [Euryarchaeota archaeon]|nr:putative Ig domain-containing protein [Euryarchaeota archaeon]